MSEKILIRNKVVKLTNEFGPNIKKYFGLNLRSIFESCIMKERPNANIINRGKIEFALDRRQVLREQPNGDRDKSLYMCSNTYKEEL